MKILVIVTILIWAAALLLRWKLPFLLGRSGEKFVSKMLLKFDPQKYTVLDNLMIPSHGRLSTTQIDHVVVSNYGIFVIETKSYTGWIFGNAYDKQWTQVLFLNRYRFYNPVHQNYAHTKAVEALIRPLFPVAPIVGFVAFPSADKIQITGTEAVGQTWYIVAKITEYWKQVISDVDKQKIVDQLTAANIQDKKARKQHVLGARALKTANGF